jgi:nucleoside-diphosphate-sugar epimerase
MHVANASQAFAHLLAASIIGAVNVASRQPVIVAGLGAILARLAGRPDLLTTGTPRAGEPLSMAADATRLRATGFAPRKALEDGLARLWSEKEGQGSALDPQKGQSPFEPIH